MASAHRRKGRQGISVKFKNEFGVHVRRKSPYSDGPKAMAESLAYAYRLEAEAAKIAEGLATRSTPFMQVVSLYAEWQISHNREDPAKRSTECINRIVSTCTIKTWKDITLARLQAYQQRRLDDGAAGSSINTELRHITAFVNWSIRYEHIEKSPFGSRRLDSLPETRNKKRALTPAECQRLLQAAPHRYRQYWALFLHTGLRLSELCGLTWARFDPKEKTLFIPPEGPVPGERSKAHKAETIRLDAVALDIVSGQPFHGATEAYIFLCPKGHKLKGPTLRWNFNSTIAKARLNRDGPEGKLCIHALRHTFGSLLIEAGASLKSVQEAMRHATAAMTLDLYGHFFEENVRHAIEHNPLNDFVPKVVPSRAQNT